jgi:hypothetical protein
LSTDVDGLDAYRFALTEHRLHHANPDDAVLAIFWQIWICFALVYLIVGGAFVAGALVAYAWYLFVHHCAHHGPDSLPLSLLKDHQSHHRFASRNCGVSTSLWDRILVTSGQSHRFIFSHSDGSIALPPAPSRV